MRLFYSPFHSFVHKTLVVAHEAGLWETLTRVPTFPFRDLNGRFVTGQYDMSKLAPLGKVPCLALEDGTVLYGSQTIVEFLDAQRVTNRLFPPDGAKRWDALRRLALGDTLFECAVQLSMEAWLPEEARRRTLYEWVWPKIVATLDEAERWAATNPDFDIGSAGLLQGVSYLGEEGSTEDLLHPRYRWRDGRPALGDWYDVVIQRPSVQTHLNVDYDGDMSPENHQRHVQAVIDIRKTGR
ncbi:MAG: glutathione S-transferase [Gammaproteobacteria bacterium]|nr:glutathione S-transferase [Gammaproteobacteria bacterium]MDE0413508.1 glutathione S-transferase [Gammaproteobacteria bacterium]